MVLRSALADFVSRSWDVLLVLDRDTAAIKLASVGATKDFSSCSSSLRGQCCLCLLGNVDVSDWHEYIAHLQQVSDGFVRFKTTLRTSDAVCRPQDGHSTRAVSVILQVFESSELICAIHPLEWKPCEGIPHTATKSGSQMGFSPQCDRTVGQPPLPQLEIDQQTCSGSGCKHFPDFKDGDVPVADFHVEHQLAKLAIGFEKCRSPALGAPPHLPDCPAGHDDLSHVDGSSSDT